MNGSQSVAILGAGTMGSAFARRLLGAGMRVTVWDRTADVAALLAPAGAVIAATPEKAVREAVVVITMVPTIAAIEELMPRAMPALLQGATWLQMSTIGIDGTERAIALARKQRPDVVFVDAPVSGSRAPQRRGSCSFSHPARWRRSMRWHRYSRRSVKRRCDGSVPAAARA